MGPKAQHKPAAKLLTALEIQSTRRAGPSSMARSSKGTVPVASNTRVADGVLTGMHRDCQADDGHAVEATSAQTIDIVVDHQMFGAKEAPVGTGISRQKEG